jgi:hypothetical protein
MPKVRGEYFIQIRLIFKPSLVINVPQDDFKQ